VKNKFLLLILISSLSTYAQEIRLKGSIRDKKENPLANVTVLANGIKTSSDTKGNFELRLNSGKQTIRFNSVGFDPISKSITLKRDTSINIVLSTSNINIEDVYVTAQESKNITTSSVINKEAMQLLQPSSFADLLELLPGGRAQDPNLTSFNAIKLREVNLKGKAISSDKYDMSSLGISFYVDGAPINTNSDLQSLNNYSNSTNNSSRENTNRGLDLRALGTDDIEKVTIVRGIPSVEYGDLTSGLVLIERKKGASPYTFRAKADGFGKLFALGKGYSLDENTFLNVDLGFTRSTSNPTESFENFNRATGSVRFDKTWRGSKTFNLKSYFDYNTTLDNKKTDPDNSYLLDKYYGSKQRYAWNNQLSIKYNQKWIDELQVVSNFSLNKDVIDEDKWIQARTATILVNSLEPGSHEAQYLTPSYLSHIYVEGLPFTAYHKVVSNHHITFDNFHNKLKFGLESNYSKNFGQGQVYDLNYPATATSEVTARPRTFKSIPGTHTLSGFAEDNLTWNIQNFKLEAAVGVRAFSMTSLSDDYTMGGKVYFEPRTNVRLHLPKFAVNNKPFEIILGGGVGVHKKTPTLDHLYPNLQYRDIVELNFYHNNAEFRVAQAYTDITNPINYQITPATNNKFELNTDFEYNGNRLSLTLFKENMQDAFRPYSLYKTIAYNLYDNTSIDLANLNQKPSPSDFTSVERNEFYAYTLTENASQILKNGFEFQFNTRRFSGINTRFTLNGAYYKTQYKNSQEIWKIDRDIVHNGLTRQVAGKYFDDDGYLREMLNSNFTADSYLPALGLNLSASFQALWFTVSQSMPKSGIPLAYKFAEDNLERPFTEASLNDPTLKQLIETYSPTAFLRTKVPLDLQVNLKASKSFKDYIKASVFVNRLFLYRPDYTSILGINVVRDMDAPYFGMELSISL
jgi:hypothetical protein